MVEIVKEVRWELDIRGYKQVKIFISGGVNEENLDLLNIPEVDGFGIGTSLSNAPVIDFALDIIEREGVPVAKRGKLGGRKEYWRCPTCLAGKITLWESSAPKCRNCSSIMERGLVPLIKQGEICTELLDAKSLRKRVLEQIQILKG
jgi:nicotinate phosphoribosyltransferase